MQQEVIQQFRNMVASAISGLHTAMPGTIMSFDGASGRAVVVPSGKYRTPTGTLLDFPTIGDVPVIIPQSAGQQATIAFPIKPGDGCLLVFAEQSLYFWMSGKDTGGQLANDLSNAIAIPGLFPTANPILAEACNRNAIVIAHGGHQLSVSAAGIALTGDVRVEGNLYVSGAVNATQGVSGASISLTTHTHGGVEQGNGSTGPAQ